jgi:transposase
MVQVVHERCCGLDVHKKTVVACAIVPDADGKPGREVRTFGTMTADLLKLSEWLVSRAVTHVAMESTGVYWKPVYNLLEGSFELLLVNAAHLKAVPGRKTDVRDAEWIADLLHHGLLRASFVPDRCQRELRELTRYRTSLVRERASEVNRLAKTLEGANIKLGSVASDLLGVSARAMLEGLLEGKMHPAALAKLARGRLREKTDKLELALSGQFGAHQRFMVASQLAHIDFLDEAIGALGTQIEARMGQEAEEGQRPFEEAVELLDTIPGIARRAAETIIAEIGTDMSRFPTAAHLASWAGMCPGNNESAGKRRSGKTRRGSPWLRGVLVEAAQAAARTKGTYLSALYHRLAARRGRKKAVIAVAHAILLIVYRLIDRHETYRDLGANYHDERNREATIHRLVGRLERLGQKVSLEPIPAAA